MSRQPILDIKGLRTVFRTRAREIVAVNGVDITVDPGETVALVGESGSGKSVTSLSIMRLLARKVGFIDAGSILLRGKSGQTVDLAAIDDEAMRRIRGNDIGMVFQEPMTSLNPVYTIGDQIGEPLRVHRGTSRREARSGSGTSRQGRHSRCPPPRRAVSARIVRRHAPACNDSHGADMQSDAPDRR